ncbi:hypothetical protein C8R45DRAFT_961905 [Mycena sanguinolenta]|nr:hypothetical protein C8R45DRAFT_961905 [Mycena sanguinolenta]
MPGIRCFLEVYLVMLVLLGPQNSDESPVQLKPTTKAGSGFHWDRCASLESRVSTGLGIFELVREKRGRRVLYMNQN